MVRFGTLVVVVVAACGGSIVSSDGGADAPVDAADGSMCPCLGACPTTPPTPGVSCSPNTLACEYGSNPDPNCNQLFECGAGKWQDRSTHTVCPPQSDCPADYASVPANQSCSPQSLTCAYAQGECICTTNFGGLQMQNPAWDCFPATTGCPSPRPDIGSPCTSDTSNQQCDYGACSGGVALECNQGEWQQVTTPCPG